MGAMSIREMIVVMEHRIASCNQPAQHCKCCRFDRLELDQLYTDQIRELERTAFEPCQFNQQGSCWNVKAGSLRRYEGSDVNLGRTEGGAVFREIPDGQWVVGSDDDHEDVARQVAQDEDTWTSWRDHRQDRASNDTELGIFSMVQRYTGDGRIPNPVLKSWDHPKGHKTQGRFWRVGHNSSHEFCLGQDEYGELWKLSLEMGVPIEQSDPSFRQLESFGDAGYMGHL